MYYYKVRRCSDINSRLFIVSVGSEKPLFCIRSLSVRRISIYLFENKKKKNTKNIVVKMGPFYIHHYIVKIKTKR